MKVKTINVECKCVKCLFLNQCSTRKQFGLGDRVGSEMDFKT